MKPLFYLLTAAAHPFGLYVVVPHVQGIVYILTYRIYYIKPQQNVSKCGKTTLNMCQNMCPKNPPLGSRREGDFFVSSIRLFRHESDLVRPRTFRIVRPFPREALLLRQITECLPVRQQCGIVFPGYRNVDIPCGLFLVPFDKPCRRVKASVTLGTDACGAGRFRVVFGNPGGSGCCGLFIAPGLFRLPERDEWGNIRFIIVRRQRVVDVVRPLDVTAPLMPLECVHILGRGEIEAQREAVNEDEMVGWYNCNMLFHNIFPRRLQW